MSGQSFPGVPVNPRLKFGVPLAEVCEQGILHPGLRELFLKAYLSGGGYDRTEEEQFNRRSKIPYVLEALKAGPKGQGRLADRISLKLKVESGKWIIATQVPPGAPLWLLRHFLGCLPVPLLDGSDWRTIAVACGAAPHPKKDHNEDEVLRRISTALEGLPTENCLMLVALVLLIRNLSAVMPIRDSASLMLHEEAVEALSQYFTAAIISRPYRPGLYTTLDKEHKPLLVFLAKRWLEVEELCRHTGISRYHSTCESRYEFVSPDIEVDHTMRQALVTTAKDIDKEIDAALEKCPVRKSNHQQLPQITSPQRSTSCTRILKKEVKPIDVAVAQTIQKTEIFENKVPVTVQMPKGVYFIPPKVECIRTSIVDEEATAEKVMVDFMDTLALVDTELNRVCAQQDDPKLDYLGYHLLRKLTKEKSTDIQKFDVKDLISKYEREAVMFAEANHQDFNRDVLPPKRNVMLKINGTQTFACEFSEDNQPTEVEKLQNRTNNRSGFSGREDTRKSHIREQRLEDNIRPSNGPMFSKILGKRTSIPLTKSTALILIKNLTSADREETVYLPTRSSSVDLPDEKLFSEVDQAMRLQDKETFTHLKDERSLRNSLKDVNRWSHRKPNSNYKDFVTELKNNFMQGRRRPSLAKFSSSAHILRADDSGQDIVFTTAGQGTSEVLNVGEFLCEKVTSFKGSAESDPVISSVNFV